MRLAAFLACLALAAPSPAAAAAQQNQGPMHGMAPVRLQLKWLHQFQFAGYYAAIEKGYYREEGLAVELLEGKPGLVPAQALLDGKADFAVDAPSIVIQRQQGAPLVALAAIFQHSPTVVLTRGDSGITRPQDLRGKRVMLTPVTDPELLAMLSNENVPLDSLTMVAHTWGIDELLDGDRRGTRGGKDGDRVGELGVGVDPHGALGAGAGADQ